MTERLDHPLRIRLAVARRPTLARIAVILGLELAFTVQAQGGAGQWTSSRLPGETILAIVTDPIDPLTVYACAGSATYKSSDGGETWTAIFVPSNVVVVDPGEPSTLYASASGLSKSVDGGRNWFPIEAGLSCRFVRALAIDRANPAVLFAGTANVLHGFDQCGGLFRSMTSESSWDQISSAFTSSVEIDPKAPSTIFVLRLLADGAANALFRTDDGGLGWTSVGSGLPTYSLDVLPDPVIAHLVFAATISGVYVSRDNGDAWFPSGLAGMVVTALVADPRNSDLWYAGTNDGSGVFRSTDHGQSWSFFGLAGIPINALAVSAQSTRLFAGTDGNGVFSFDVVTRSSPIPIPKRHSTRRVPARVF